METKRIKMAMVGANFGRHIVAEIANEHNARHFELAVVCDMDHARADSVAAGAGVKACYDYQEVLDDKGIEAIGLFTGPAGRAELLRRAIRAGKHVITTKPFEIDADNGLEVLREARKLGRVIHMNSPNPVLPSDLVQINKWRQELNLGQPIGCRADVWVRYFDKPDGTWYDDPKRCPVAPVYRLGIYLINDLIRLIGPPKAVTVLHSRIFTGRPTDDNGQLSILFENGAIGNIFASFCVDDGQYYANSCVLNFERGTIFSNLGPSPYGKANSGRMQAVTRTGPEQNVVHLAQVNPAERSGCYLWDVFYRAIGGEQIPGEVTPEEIVAGVRVINAMQRAVESGRIEEV